MFEMFLKKNTLSSKNNAFLLQKNPQFSCCLSLLPMAI